MPTHLSVNAPPADPDTLLTYPQAAKLLQISERTLATMVATHEVPHVRFRGNVRFSRQALLEWINQQMRGGSSSKEQPDGGDQPE